MPKTSKNHQKWLSAITTLLLLCVPLVVPADSSAKTKKQCVIEYQDKTLADCPDEGCGGDPKLNTAKNRTDKAQDHNPEGWTLEDIVTLNEDSPSSWHKGADRDELEQIGEGTAVVVKGYLIYADLTETLEACNCYISGEASNDFHLNLAPYKPAGDKASVRDAKADSIVVEITPRYRPSGWALSKLKDHLAKNRAYVRVTGWLMYDSMHTGLGQSWRATPWEVHPVTRFEACTKTKSKCDQGDGWKLLEDYQP